MRRSAIIILSALLTTPIGLALTSAQEPAGRSTKSRAVTRPDGEALTEKVVKTDREWAKLLTRDQFLVTRMKETEPPFTGKYVHSHARGTYRCVCCDAELFSSQTKFESGTGWPSFYQPLSRDATATAVDYNLGYPRTEVECSRCGAHLGHIFDDGPPPTGLRYCINSVALKFAPEKSAAKAKKSLARTKTKAKKAAAKAKAQSKEAEAEAEPDEAPALGGKT